MRWLFFAIVLRCCVCEIAYRDKNKEKIDLEVEPVNYGKDEYFLRIGGSKKINCKGPRNQKLDWYSPSGEVVSHQPSDRVYVRDPSVASYRFPTRTQTLTITTAALEDSGEWQCRSGHVHKSVSLCVLDPVEIEIREPEKELSVEMGRSITLACPVRGEPEPSVYWVKNDEDNVISDDNNSTKYKMMMNYKNQGMEALLTIISLEPDDAGIYSCVAMQMNPLVEACHSTAVANITLNVNYKPMFDVKQKELPYFALEDEEIELPCKAQAFPPPTYRWFHETREDLFAEIDEEMLKYSDSYEVALRLNAKIDIFGEKYRCLAINQYGKDYIQYTIKKLEKPSAPDEIIISNTTEDSIEFNITWVDESQKVESVDVQYFKSSHKGKSVIKESYWRRTKVIGFIIEDFDPAGNLITLSDLDEETLYSIRFRAVNRAGESPWSAPIQASTIAKVEPTTIPYEDEPWSPLLDKGMIFGILFTVVIIAAGAACILIIKRL